MVEKTGKTEKEAPQVSAAADQWQNTFDAIKDAISLIDGEGKIVRCNKAMSGLLGKPFQEIIGRKCWELVHGASEPIAGCPVARMKETHQRETLTLKIKDRWFEVTADPILDESGGLSGAVHILSDITEHKRVNEELQRSKEAYKNLIENLNDIIYTISIDGLITYVSPVVKEHLGFSPAELIGRPFKEVIHPEDLDRIVKAFHDVLENRLYPSEYRQLKKNGEVCWVLASSRPVYENNKLIGIQGALRDITARKKIEEILKKEQQELKLIIDSSPIIVFYKDKEGKFIRVNKTFAKAIKLPEEEFMGKTVFDLYSAKIAQDMTNDDREVLKSGSPKLNIIEQYESADGIRWAQTDKIPICDKNGIPVGIIGFAQDITERKQAEEALQKGQARLIAIMDSIEAMVYVADMDTHEVLFINKYGKNLFGDVVGKKCWQALQQGQDGPCKFCTNDKLIGQDGEPIGIYQWESCHERTGRWFDRRDRAIQWADKKRARLEIATDITERKRAEEELGRYRKHLEEVVKDRTAELEEKTAKLERLNKVFVGRELRMKELKEKIKELEERITPPCRP